MVENIPQLKYTTQSSILLFSQILVIIAPPPSTSQNFIQAYFRDIVALVLGNHNKANITIRRVTGIFLFFIAYESYVYTRL